MPQPRILVCPDPAAVASAAADLVADAAASAIREHDLFTLALSGGHTPALLYETLAAEPYLSRIEWPKVEFFFGDERCVPPQHPDSNFAVAQKLLFDRAPIPADNIHRIRGEIEPEAAAIEYGQLLKRTFGDGGVDLALLGMGTDGHTASLFPHTAALAETHHRCVANYVPHLKSWRVTMSAPFLNRSAAVVVMATGKDKALRIEEVLEGERDPQRLPIQLIDPPEGTLTWLMDTAAAGM
jgi:6-phosphogluconolactonase